MSNEELQRMSETICYLTESFIEDAEDANVTNEQWFLEWEDKMNAFTIKDHKPVQN